MRITKISVNGLFGMFDHEILLNQESRITIVHGPNGVGKTVMLQMLHGLFNYDYEIFGEIPFEQFRVEYENGEFIAVEKFAAANKLSIRYWDGSGSIFVPFKPTIFDRDDLIRAVAVLTPNLVLIKRGGKPYWFFEDNIGEIQLWGGDYELGSSSIFDRAEFFTWYYEVSGDYDELLYNDDENWLGPFAKIPDWFVRIRSETNTSFIQTQRLLSNEFEDSLFENYDSFGGSTINLGNPKPATIIFGSQ